MDSSESQPENCLDLSLVLSAAVGLHQAGQLEQAEALYLTIIDQFPQCLEALHFLGLLMHHQGEHSGGIELIERVLVEAPDYQDARINLGNIFLTLKRFDAAVDSYRRVLTAAPGNIPAWNNLGIALKALDRLDESVAVLLNAIGLMPDNAELFHNLGNSYRKQCKFAEAAQAYRRALELRPYNPEDYENLCVMLYLLQQFDEAIPLVEQWLKHDPRNPLALHRLYAFSGQSVLERAGDEYVRQTFDGFADCFDTVLEKLDYKAPQLVAAALGAVVPATGAALRILDAGCGTGLCGPLLRSHASQLSGIDLSPKMLERAAIRACYDELFQGELTAFIGTHHQAFDAIVSADTLVYFGDLTPVFRAVKGALVAGGHFVFTLESEPERSVQAYKINPHGRFSHTQGYVEATLAEVGFYSMKMDAVTLRSEGGLPVYGFLVLARC